MDELVICKLKSIKIRNIKIIIIWKNASLSTTGKLFFIVEIQMVFTNNITNPVPAIKISGKKANIFVQTQEDLFLK